MQTLTTRRILSVTAWAAVLTLLGGCHSHSIAGRVVDGQAGVASTVALDKTRKDQAGLSGVEIEVRTQEKNSESELVGKATSDATGAFSVPISESLQIRDRLRVTARRDGYIPLRGDFYIPGEDKLLLLVMKSTGPSPTPTTGLPASKPADDKPGSK